MTKLISKFWLGLALFFCNQANANLTIISDEETELYLQDIVHPIFKAANVPYNRNKIFIVDDKTLNAFVSDGNDLFINTEVFLRAKSSDEISGVIAHEVGHIQGGHILRQKLRMQEMQNISLASMVIAGAVGAMSGRGDVAMAMGLGTYSSLLNQSLSYRVEEERSADEAAIKILNKIKKSPQGLLDFMKKIQVQNKLRGIDEVSYFRTHPMTSERISFLSNAVRQSPFKPIKLSQDEALKRIQAKLFAFTKHPSQTAIKYPSSDNSIEAKYAHAIVAFKKLNPKKALKLINESIRKEPRNPHFRELKGQILLEHGKIDEAKKEFYLAAELLPNSNLFKINVAQAVLEGEPTETELNKIIRDLRKVQTERQMLIGWLLLSKACEKKGLRAEAEYAAAEFSFHLRDLKLAKRQAERAKKQSMLPALTLKIEDLIRRIKNLER